ncbi:protein naked cuticle homolog 2-like isoform X2 [Actinia tenebrosa]|uniref:Protein naked cuticle homolog n=1 Tax=Actinia tenebrosa TaxID=6105 RepID=A0A6P8IUN5_ACTTE|nr:protein naked cuticle homolog 2-like isoform X2 [Actinia tenebrosa]
MKMGSKIGKHKVILGPGSAKDFVAVSRKAAQGGLKKKTPAGRLIHKMKKLNRKLTKTHQRCTRQGRAWISREGPEGDCVIENDTTNSSSVSQGTTEDLIRPPCSHTADFMYKGYPVNLEEPFEPEKIDPKKCFFYDDYPLEVVELPDLPDGKKIELTFDREGLVEASTQTTKPFKEISECGMSVKSVGSDHQEWSYTLYDFEGKGQVTRDDLKNLVKSIYEVLGKSVAQSKNQPKDPLKKLKVRLSVSKERGKNGNGEPSTCHEYVISAVTQDHTKKSRTRTYPVERCDSMAVNPPESLMDIHKVQSIVHERTVMEGLEKGIPYTQKTNCKKCDHGRKSKSTTVKEEVQRNPASADPNPGGYRCPKRMQTGPGECNPPSPQQTDLCRVRDWLNKLCEPNGGQAFEKTESRHRHRKSRHHSCKQDSFEPDFDLHRCPQYLDLATDHATYPYHVQSHACLYGNPSPRQRHSKHPKGGHYHSCKHQREVTRGPNQRTVVHQHEHHHHHSHHHYHHYID